MVYRRATTFALVFLLAGEASLQTAWPPLMPVLPEPIFSYSGTSAFMHSIGRDNHADYRIERPGYLVSGLSNGGQVLSEGTYEYDFYFSLRRGHLPGLLSDANDIARVEAVDATANARLIDRTFQRADFPTFHDRQLVRKSLIFTTWDRGGHRFEPKVYWPGLSGLQLSRIELRALPTASARALKDKAMIFEKTIEPEFLEHGFVVMRNGNGVAQDQGDAAIWTGLYAASEAWRYRTTHDPHALDHMDRSLWALHELAKNSPTPGTLVRYVDADGTVWPDPPSKDTYGGFIFGVTQCMPAIRSPELRHALQSDVVTIAGYFLDHDLTLPFSKESTVDLNPSIPNAFISIILQDLRETPDDAHRLKVILRALQLYFLLEGQRPVPSFRRLIRWLNHPNANWEPSAVDLLNDATRMIGQVQKNVHKSANIGNAELLSDAPYVKLDLLLLRVRQQLNEMTKGHELRQTDQLKIRPSESLLSLHLIKAAAEIVPKPNRFDTYYQANLWQNKALLQTALQWSQIDEDFNGILLGETYASVNRSDSSHLSFLVLYDLVDLERDPYLQFQYKKIFERQFQPMRGDGNAMLQAMENRMGLAPSQWGLTLWSLTHYPIDRVGRGEAYWQAHRQELAHRYGWVAGKTRDPLPLDLRPRDAFIWQRSARATRGDQKGWVYPPMDYLFAYWLGQFTERSARPLEEKPGVQRSLKMTGAPPTPVPLPPSS